MPETTEPAQRAEVKRGEGSRIDASVEPTPAPLYRVGLGPTTRPAKSLTPPGSAVEYFCLPSLGGSRSRVAQLVEQTAVNRLVAGSSPAAGVSFGTIVPDAP